VDANTLEADFS